jgi:ketosteroid isomerase-like protein
LADHPNVNTFRSIYYAFTNGDMDALSTFFHEAVVWHTPGQHALAGTYVGRTETFSSFAEEFERSAGSYSVEVRDVLANDEHIVALLHATADRRGKRLNEDYVIVFHMRDGKVDAAWEIWKDQPAVDEFWS